MEKPKRAATGRDSDKYIVRFPPDMRDHIAEEAKRNNRSMNAEIIARLDSSFNTGGSGAAIAAIAQELSYQETICQTKQLSVVYACDLITKLMTEVHTPGAIDKVELDDLLLTAKRFVKRNAMSDEALQELSEKQRTNSRFHILNLSQRFGDPSLQPLLNDPDQDDVLGAVNAEESAPAPPRQRPTRPVKKNA